MHEPSKATAETAAAIIRNHFDLKGDIKYGLQLGTGWGDVLEWEQELPFQKIPGFKRLGALKRHARSVAIGTVGGKRVLALRGRVHLNEAPADPNIYAMARLQVEMLQELGVDTLVATCAVGSLVPEFQVGDIVVADSFITAFAPDMPGFVGEFDSPEDTLKEELIEVALSAGAGTALKVHRGTHLMVRGPFFEGRKKDKALYASFGGQVIGMSLLTEACIMATRKHRTLGLCFVSNDMVEVHDDEIINARVRAKSDLLGDYLNRIAAAIE